MKKPTLRQAIKNSINENGVFRVIKVYKPEIDDAQTLDEMIAGYEYLTVAVLIKRRVKKING